MANKETTLSQDVKTVFIGGCKTLVSWIQTFGKSKESESTWTEPSNHDFSYPVTDYVKKKLPKAKRARTLEGRYRGDDPNTKNVNEAWVGGKAPKKRKK